jgi:hypothetical protein
MFLAKLPFVAQMTVFSKFHPNAAAIFNGRFTLTPAGGFAQKAAIPRRRGGRVRRGRMAPGLVSLPAGGDSVRPSSVRFRSAGSSALIGSPTSSAPLLDSSVSGNISVRFLCFCCCL